MNNWYYRATDEDEWFGPMSYRDANSQARRSTLPKYLADHIHVKYAQVGRMFGSQSGEPLLEPQIVVVYIYANGRQYISGKIAQFNADKVPLDA